MKDGKSLGLREGCLDWANRDTIIKYADEYPSAERRMLRNAVQPSRLNCRSSNPQGEPLSHATADPAGGGKHQARLKIALLVTNPDSMASLQTGVEARYIEEGVRLESKAGEVDLKVVLAPTLDTLLDTLNSYRPDIIHFSGHGGGRTLLFDNERAGDDGGTVLDFDMVARVVGATSAAPKLLVLAACDTVDGDADSSDTIPVVIAMADTIDDEAACEFSRRFDRSALARPLPIRSSKQSLYWKAKGTETRTLPSLVARDNKVLQRALL